MNKLLIAGALLSSIGTPFAYASDTLTQNIVSFGVQNSAEVANDEISATLTKTVQAKTAPELAKKINPIINQALAISKKYPSVKVSTGSPSSYPTCDDAQRITGFTGQARLNLESQDSESLSALIAELQNLLVLENMAFRVSDQLSDATKQSLMLSTSRKFQDEAMTISKAWGAHSYRLLEAKLDNQDGYDYRPALAAPMMMRTSKDEIAPQNLEAGTTTINYTINGSIQLIY